jgi:hypothetical protein
MKKRGRRVGEKRKERGKESEVGRERIKRWRERDSNQFPVSDS